MLRISFYLFPMLLLGLCLLFACTPNGAGSAKQGKSADSTTSNTDTVETNKPASTDSSATNSQQNDKPTTGNYFYRGSGNEPGWYILLRKAEGGNINAQLVLDYGEQNLNATLLMAQTRDVNASISNLTGETVGKDGKKVAIGIHIEKGECIDDGEFKHESHIEMKVGDKSYKGCGDFGKQ